MSIAVNSAHAAAPETNSNHYKAAAIGIASAACLSRVVRTAAFSVMRFGMGASGLMSGAIACIAGITGTNNYANGNIETAKQAAFVATFFTVLSMTNGALFGAAGGLATSSSYSARDDAQLGATLALAESLAGMAMCGAYRVARRACETVQRLLEELNRETNEETNQ